MEASTSDEYDDFAKTLEEELMMLDEEDHGAYFDDEGSQDMHNECSGSGGVELDHSDGSDSSFDGSDCDDVESKFPNLFTKRRKLTSHWRAFIHPLMWRCKWVELQIKKLDAQSRAYAHNNAPSDQALSRKRRRRSEATNNVEAYMSRHNLFSYYEHKKHNQQISHNVVNNSGTCEEGKSDSELGNDEARDCNKDHEDILERLEGLQRRAHKLRSLFEEEKEDYFRSVIWPDGTLDLPLPRKPKSTYHRMPVGTHLASQLLAEYNLGGVLLPESAHPGPLPKPTRHHPPSTTHAYQNEDEGEDDDDVLIDNQRVRDEVPYFEKGIMVVNHEALASKSRAEPQDRSTTKATKTNTRCKNKTWK
ncbi:uncharacterized protein LOC121800526 isoform X1 [Salvia splendens]|uniref:uncharacterized protein LOC121800526 isoform X1 n=1 Tax=Salvia splendens TaxID=180675 RepID=UPI001C25F293|nr:uncharacterized protein LOC121800526 isoform X1 [Salvia splendens]XP_042056028.1 uncharacterized protein LOC121800526 isoform X1 [Salvia splendens]